MSDETRPLPLPPEIKDGLRRARARLRETGSGIVESGASNIERSRSLRPMIAEMARSMDRFLGRTEHDILRAIRPSSTLAQPPFQPQMIRACLEGTASPTLDRSFERQLRAWLALSLRLFSETDAILLEKPLREAFAKTRSTSGSDLTGRAAELLQNLVAAPIWRKPKAGAKDAEAHWADAVQTVTIALLSAANRRSKAPLQPLPLLEAARRLVQADETKGTERSSIDWSNTLSRQADMI